MQSSFGGQTEKEKLYAMFSDIFSNGGTGDCQIGHESPRKISREFPYVVQNLLRDIQLLISLCGTKFTPRHPIAQPQRF